jgi:hypothetical protein
MSIYILDKNNQSAGPYSDNDVRNLLANKQILPDALACLDGETKWVTVASLLDGAPSAPPPPPPPSRTTPPTNLPSFNDAVPPAEKGKQSNSLSSFPKRFCLRYVSLYKSGGILRKIGLILLPLFLLGAIFGEKSESGKSRTKSSEPITEQQAQMTPISARELLDQFESNEIAAVSNFSGKRIKISGKITKISTGIFDTDLLVDIGFVGPFFDRTYATCSFVASEKKSLAKFSKGQDVVILGYVNGKLLGDVHLYDCLDYTEAEQQRTEAAEKPDDNAP